MRRRGAQQRVSVDGEKRVDGYSQSRREKEKTGRRFVEKWEKKLRSEICMWVPDSVRRQS